MEPETMDDFSIYGEEVIEALDKIAKINRLLGGNKLTVSAVEQMASTVDKGSEITITDLGCGNGDMLRKLSDRGKRANLDFRLKGIDANAFTVSHAKALSNAYPDISYTCANIMDKDFVPERCDIILLTLTLHHFNDDQILQLLQRIIVGGTKAIIINDLHRSKLSYVLFGWMSSLAGLSRMNTEDGKLSIIKGFKRKDLQLFATELKVKKHSICWKWAFRYQWIISDL
jgi:2-polyprenyl-3-methyl-5-hydroxy-6-metoxy-1,4-benzoquinol methylase